MELKDKKKHILEAAEELFANKGFEAATVRDIADAAGVNLAMISYYFGSKEKMMESLFHERMEVMKMKVESLIKNDSLTPFQKIESVIEEYVKKIYSKQAFHKIMICEQIMKKNPVIIKLVRELKVSYALLFSELVKQGQKKKVFKKNVDVFLAISTMTGTVSQMIINKDYYSDFYHHENLSEEEIKKVLYNNTTNHLKQIFKTILGYEQ
jgi:hypothetical protein